MIAHDAPPSRLPDPRICEQARISRDPRFDGLFFTAVTSTGIYCRPVCPVRSPKREHIRYYPTAAAAEAAGFRPCLRCRPELAPGEPGPGDATLTRALKLIEDGFLADEPLAALADRVGVGERQLRRIFVERLGATPPSVHRTRRLLFAKQLLTETSMRITDVALEAGFGSLRRFNACFRDVYGEPPRELRRRQSRAVARDEVLELRLTYRPPYDFQDQLDALRSRAFPGIEVVTETSYTRAFGPLEAPGWLRVSAGAGGANALCMELYCPRTTRILDIVARVRRMFDLDADPETIGAALSADDRLRPLIERRPGRRLSGAWNGLEVAVETFLGQRHGLRAGRELTRTLAEARGGRLDGSFPPGLSRLFPTARDLADASLRSTDLGRGDTAGLRTIVDALVDGRVDFRRERMLTDVVARWSALPGIDRAAAHQIALRALGHADALPSTDAIRSRTSDNGHSEALLDSVEERAERWRPWRAYAFTYLDRS